MKPTTLVFPIDEQNRILLGRKKRGFGADKYIMDLAVNSRLVKASETVLFANYLRNLDFMVARKI